LSLAEPEPCREKVKGILKEPEIVSARVDRGSHIADQILEERSDHHV
jgi:hypothetical protein